MDATLNEKATEFANELKARADRLRKELAKIDGLLRGITPFCGRAEAKLRHVGGATTSPKPKSVASILQETLEQRGSLHRKALIAAVMAERPDISINSVSGVLSGTKKKFKTNKEGVWSLVKQEEPLII